MQQQTSNQQRPIPATPAPNSVNTTSKSCEPAEWKHADSKNPGGETRVGKNKLKDVRCRLFKEEL